MYLCVGESILLLCMIFLLEFGTVQTVWYFFHVLTLSNDSVHNNVIILLATGTFSYIFTLIPIK